VLAYSRRRVLWKGNVKLTTVLVVQGLVLATAVAQEAVFYRIASTNETRITACEPPNALLTWTSTSFEACCRVERAEQPGGPWISDFPHTVVANIDGGGTALVPLGAGGVPDAFSCAAVLARVTNAIRFGTNCCRIEAYVYRDLMPGSGPPSGVIAVIRLIETNGLPIPGSVTIPRFEVINGAEVWTVYWPARTPVSPLYVLEVRGGDGPFWTPGTRVDVVVEVANGNVRYLLKAADQTIQAVY
jgi:hypothetical protein